MYEYSAKVLNVVDGDTFDLLIDVGFNIHIKERVRLSEVDAYEVRLGKKTNELQKRKGIKAKGIAVELLEGKFVKVKTEKVSKGKYGRYIINLYYKTEDGNLIEWCDFAEYLLELKLAVRKSY